MRRGGGGAVGGGGDFALLTAEQVGCGGGQGGGEAVGQPWGAVVELRGEARRAISWLRRCAILGRGRRAILGRQRRAILGRQPEQAQPQPRAGGGGATQALRELKPQPATKRDPWQLGLRRGADGKRALGQGDGHVQSRGDDLASRAHPLEAQVQAVAKGEGVGCAGGGRPVGLERAVCPHAQLLLPRQRQLRRGFRHVATAPAATAPAAAVPSTSPAPLRQTVRTPYRRRRELDAPAQRDACPPHRYSRQRAGLHRQPNRPSRRKHPHTAGGQRRAHRYRGGPRVGHLHHHRVEDALPPLGAKHPSTHKPAGGTGGVIR
mmetsp:Transcript_19801/g.62157  ORF Transcript_19801/g.62157 Transcript_19801/m.62157 type:complete len:320 (-) Transcript_19801:407-1366(-)